MRAVLADCNLVSGDSFAYQSGDHKIVVFCPYFYSIYDTT